MAKQRRRGTIERLEHRYALTQFGVPWPVPQQLTYSFVPDGTLVEGSQPSNLFASLNDASGSTDWQAAVTQALQTWAAATNVNFTPVPDGGEALGAPGLVQGDPRFGDIRLAAAPLTPDVLALGTPFSFSAGTLSGDIVLNSNYQFGEGPNAAYDLCSVVLHEVGHILGVPDSTNPASVMYGQFLGVRTGLVPDDVNAVDAVYGARPLDASNQTMATPKFLSAGGESNSSAVVDAQLANSSDTHFYSLQVFDGENTTVLLHTTGVSLLEGQLTVYDGRGNVIGSAVSASPNSGDLVVHVHNPCGNTRLLINVASATGGVFGVGAYRLVVAQGYTVPNNLLTGPVNQVRSHGDDGGEYAGSWQAPQPPQYNYSFQSNLLAPLATRSAFVTVPPATGTGPMTLTATVWATQTGAASPLVTVYDRNGNVVASQVLANENGTYSVQVVGVAPGQVYNVTVGAANAAVGSKPLGIYHLTVDFSAAPVVLDTYASGTLTAAASQSFQVLQVNTSQFFHFLLTASTSPTTSGAPANVPVAVRLTIYDPLGNVVESVVDQAGSVLSTTLFLTPGTYVFRFAAGTLANAPLPDTTFQLQGAELSDPIGPLPVNP
ncbi:MAG TPA: matrixin family metalloprotease, partial [Pirellulales bacterium]|nr:matrixin family metalloprotease [Pirellulales bacterium]